MATYMLAQLHLKFGTANVDRYNQAMVLMRTLFASEGIYLRHGMVSLTGRLYEAWNLWEIEDQGHVARALAGMANRPELPVATAALAEVVECETVRYLDTLPFGLAEEVEIVLQAHA